MGQSYYSPMTVAGGQVPSTQTDFAKLSYPTDNRFKTIGNGGHVANASGFDIRPYSDSGLTTPLTYELVYYNGSTGQFEMHVKIPSLSNGYVTYFGYGDTSLTTDGSSASTWDSNFLAVYHLKDGTTLSVASSTGSNNGTINGSLVAAAGQIDGCANVGGGNSNFISCGNGMNPTAMTISGWANASALSNAYSTLAGRIVSGSQFVLYIKSTGKLACYASATGSVSYDGTGSHTLSTSTWYYLAMTYNSSAGLIGYVNAASDGTAAANGALTTTAATFNISKDQVTTGRFLTGLADEVRVSQIARSADWITTEYNNQSAPGTFETLGTEVSLIAASTGNMFLLFP